MTRTNPPARPATTLTYKGLCGGPQGLAELLGAASIQPDLWDFLVISDGSGSAYENGCGWAAVLISAAGGQRRLIWGSSFPGSVYTGEFCGALFGLLALGEQEEVGPSWNRPDARKSRVFVVTDSKALVTAGNFPQSRRSHRPLWAAIDQMEEQWATVSWRHVPRETCLANALADRVSRHARTKTSDASGAGAQELARQANVSDISIYDV